VHELTFGWNLQIWSACSAIFVGGSLHRRKRVSAAVYAPGATCGEAAWSYIQSGHAAILSYETVDVVRGRKMESSGEAFVLATKAVRPT
jgi:hypothetical protein